jgi:hypothetical protein
MTAALIRGETVLATWDTIPNPLCLPDGRAVHCAREGWTDGEYSVVPAAHTGTAPAYPSSVLSVSKAVVNGAVEITRTWSGLTKDVYDQLVNAERDRRIARGITVEVSPGKAVPVDMRGAQDLLNIGGLAQVAKARVDAADATPVYFRGSDNITYELKPEEMWMLASSNGVAGHIQACYLKAWAIKDAAEMVKDVTADEHWK